MNNKEVFHRRRRRFLFGESEIAFLTTLKGDKGQGGSILLVLYSMIVLMACHFMIISKNFLVKNAHKNDKQRQ